MSILGFYLHLTWSWSRVCSARTPPQVQKRTQYPKIWKWKKWNSTTFLSSPMEWLTFFKNLSTCYCYLGKKLNFHFLNSPIFGYCRVDPGFDEWFLECFHIRHVQLQWAARPSNWFVSNPPPPQAQCRTARTLFVSRIHNSNPWIIRTKQRQTAHTKIVVTAVYPCC